MTPVEKVLANLHDVKKTSNGWSARCPAHDDQRPSLSIAEADDGRALLTCHAGCKVEEICAAVDLTVLDLFPTANMLPTSNKSNANGESPTGNSRIVATYDYSDELDNLLYQVVRYEPKDFRQRRPKPDGDWDWSVKGVRDVPYKLLSLLAAPTNAMIMVVEGEKDADNLARIGCFATCNAGGAGKWPSKYAEYLRGRNVIVLADNDDAGRNHAQQVAQTLHGIAESVRVVELPGLPDKGDVSDWLEAGGTKDELKRLAEAAPEWTPSATPELGPVLMCLTEIESRPVSWLWPGRIPLGRMTLLVGRPGDGKSFLSMDVAARVTTGTSWPDGGDCPNGSVILISAEDDPADTIRPRLDAVGADIKRVHMLSAIRCAEANGQYERMISLADLGAIETALMRLADCKLIVVDPIGSFLGDQTDAHRDNEVRGVLAPIAALAEKYGVAVLVIAHRRKSTGNVADDLALGSRAFTAVPRAVHHLTRDAENKSRRLLLPGKNNLAREGDGLAFSITGEPPRITWESDPVTMSADDALAVENLKRERKPGPEAEALETASEWLLLALAGGPRLAKDMSDEWINGHGGSERTLQRAKQSLGVEAYRPEVPGQWWWRLPVKDANPSEDVQLGNLGNLAENAGVLTNSDADQCKAAKLPELGNLGSERVRVRI